MRDKENHARWARAHRRTLKGFLESKYTAMSKRVRGLDKNCLRTVAGLPIVDRQTFYDWAKEQTQLYSLFWTYECSGWDFKLCPTVDRIDPKNGYVLGNMRFVTQSDNASRSRWNHVYSQTEDAIYQRVRYKAKLSSRQRSSTVC